jgi:hypothetical protein
MRNRNSRDWSFADSDSYDQESKSKKKYKEYRKEQRPHYENRHTREDQFRCLKCSLMITADPDYSGVNNRNHCPNCLWSQHVDLDKAGDRKAECRSRMRPIGLTVKRTGKKYGNAACGELMVIHQCSGCGKISINRIAADDSAGVLLALYMHTQNMESGQLQTLNSMGIQPLQAADLTTVYSQLFGWQSIMSDFTPPPEVIAEMENSYFSKTADGAELWNEV